MTPARTRATSARPPGLEPPAASGCGFGNVLPWPACQARVTGTKTRRACPTLPPIGALVLVIGLPSRPAP
jgi:hypothetical protein